jgi:phage gp29-like protein
MATKKKTTKKKTTAKRNARVQVEDKPVASVMELQRSLIASVDKVLRNGDTAYRRDRRLQTQMRRDPDIMSPLLQRQMSVALLDWDIAPQDDGDEKQVEQAAELKRLIESNLRKPHEFLRVLLEAVWYGPSAANVLYRRTGVDIVPGNWIPIHSDTLQFDDEGNVGLSVNMSFKGDTVQGINSRVRMLDSAERQATVLHVFNPSAGDFEDAYETRYPYSGRGLRDMVWYTWFLKQVALQAWATWVERNGGGMLVGKYPSGNTAGQQMIETVLTNWRSDNAVAIPDLGKDAVNGNYSLEIMESTGDSGKNFVSLIDGYLAGQIKELIIGQTATTEATASGLGSSVGDQHAETFNRIVRFDALSLADTLTHDFVHQLHRMNFGETPYRPSWRFSIDRVDPKAWLEGVEKFVNLGGSVAQSDARDILGLAEPDEGAPLLTASSQPDLGDPFAFDPELFSHIGSTAKALYARS